jgi:hypothetical protein
MAKGSCSQHRINIFKPLYRGTRGILTFWGILVIALVSCRTNALKAYYCDCSDKSQYKPMPTGSNYLILILDNGDSLCASALKEGGKNGF